MKKTALAILALFSILIAILFIRAAGFRSRQISVDPIPAIAINRDQLAERLSQAIQFKTISLQSPEDPGAEEFRRFHTFIDQSFPHVAQHLRKEVLGGYSLLYTWPGKDPKLKPGFLLAHLDVVPVEAKTESSWSQPPFSGRIAGGYVWGRGAMDDKVGVMGLLEAVEYLLANGFQPQRTIYLAFGHDEEIGGNAGAAQIAALLRSRGIELEFVLDEGLNIFNGVIAGINAPTALVGIAEKGYLSLQLTTESAGGHSSAPPADTAIGVLSRALQRLEARPFPARLPGPTRELFEFLGPEMAWTKKIVLANLWLFEPLLKKQVSRSPLTNALLRTTVALTMIHAGVKENVLPSQATATINLRLVPGDSVASATARVRDVINDSRVEVKPLPIRIEPSAVSDIRSPSFALLNRTIRQIAPQALVAPALLVAGTDSRYYQNLSKNIFRFLPITLRPDDIKRYHGIDERIAIEDYERCVRFYAQLIRNSQS
jgi:carboxypeptidase PM20D1